MTPRLKRLAHDYAQIRTKFDGDTQIDVVAINPPHPEKYQVVYKIPSTRIHEGNVYIRDLTVIEFTLSSEYPRVQPIVTSVDPVFHPNFAIPNGEPNGKVCIADFWSPAQSLADIILEVAEMLTWQKFNIRSPLNAAAAEYGQNHAQEFPLAVLNAKTEAISIEILAIEEENNVR